MSWRDLFGGKPATPTPPPEHLNCSFCGKARIEVHYLVAGPGVSICEACLVLSAAVMDEAAPNRYRVGATVVAEMAALCATADEPRLLEPLTRAAIALMADDVAALRSFAHRLMEKPTAARGRAVLLVSNAIGAARDPLDAERMVVAALSAGELAIAAAIEHPPSLLPVHVVLREMAALLHARAGDANIEARAAAVREAAKSLQADATFAERATVDCTVAIAELRCGRPAGAVAHYAKYENLQPWHDLARGDALLAIGDEPGAVAAWQRVVADVAYPYWVDEATRRLTAREPYR